MAINLGQIPSTSPVPLVGDQHVWLDTLTLEAIQDAVDAIIDAASTKPYVVHLPPGLLVMENDTHIQCKDYVSIHGSGKGSTILHVTTTAMASASALFRLANNLTVSDLSAFAYGADAVDTGAVFSSYNVGLGSNIPLTNVVLRDLFCYGNGDIMHNGGAVYAITNMQWINVECEGHWNAINSTFGTIDFWNCKFTTVQVADLSGSASVSIFANVGAGTYNWHGCSFSLTGISDTETVSIVKSTGGSQIHNFYSCYMRTRNVGTGTAVATITNLGGASKTPTSQVYSAPTTALVFATAINSTVVPIIGQRVYFADSGNGYVITAVDNTTPDFSVTVTGDASAETGAFSWGHTINLYNCDIAASGDAPTDLVVAIGSVVNVFNTPYASKSGTGYVRGAIKTSGYTKLGLFNVEAIVQPTTGIAAATFATNISLIANDSATFDGYTIGQVVKALRNVGMLA